MSALTSSFLFATCQAGAEPFLKKEIARIAPALRFAYSRPGFVTFKSPVPLSPEFELDSVFARSYGISLGKTADLSQVRDAITRAAPDHVHVFERDQHAPGEEPKDFQPGTRSKAARALLADVLVGKRPNPGELVLDVICVEKNEWWWGAHRHTTLRSPYPGGRAPVALPPEAPSRAYLKLEEAIHRFEIPIYKGDVAVEIGSAPGGASYALLQRGLKVVGIDPGEMAPIVMQNPNYSHLSRSVVAVLREELPDSVQWLLLDMNVYPEKAWSSVTRLGSRMSDTLLGCVLTFKMNNDRAAEQIPYLLDEIRDVGMAQVRAAQLPSNGREICVLALTEKGQARLELSSKA